MAQPLAIALCGKMLGPWLGEEDFRKWEVKKKKRRKEKRARGSEREGRRKCRPVRFRVETRWQMNCTLVFR